jgi:dTDP-4-dehydrorhamnose reductase
MLGSDLVAACARRGFEARAYDLPELDIVDREQVDRVVRSVDAVINCAAYTNVDGAESHRELAHRVNAEAVGQLGHLAAKAGKWVLHFSTDFVFDGTLDRPYAETDATNPISVYGRSKLEGERLLGESGCSCCVVRLQWTYGRRGNNFVTKIIEQAKTGGRLKVVDDQIGSPTATTEVAEAACKLLNQRAEGLYHFAGAGYASRFEVAGFIVEQLSLDAAVAACSSGDYPSPAQRPLNSRFDCRKIQVLLGEPIKPWQQMMERFLQGE